MACRVWTGPPTDGKWDRSHYPNPCKSCFGDKPYIQQEERGYKKCKRCIRRFRVITWCPARNDRYKKTEDFHTCYMQKNVCQACLLDLEYGPPVQTRAGFYESNERNTSHICTFYISGECTSGDECPNWIEMPVTRTPIPERGRTTGFEDYNGDDNQG